jgi:hypothetical protein
VWLSDVASNSIETFKTFGPERMALSARVLQQRQANKEREMSIGTAAFVEFDVSEAVSEAVPEAVSEAVQGTAQSRPRRIVFVPCSQNSNVTGSYTLRVYSTKPLLWSSMSVERLEDNLNAPGKDLLDQQGHRSEHSEDSVEQHGRNIDMQTMVEGEWTLGILKDEASLCGGCRNYETWLENPSFSIPVVQDAWISIDLSCRFEYDRLLASQAPAVGMYVLAGNEQVAKEMGSWVIDQSSFVRGEQNSWEVRLKGCPVPYTLLVCTYEPKCRGTFAVTVTRMSDF